ncbi:MAG: hypothetical protein Q8P93_02975 [bacterium]|nr:hypothetical protein [bacterium]
MEFSVLGTVLGGALSLFRALAPFLVTGLFALFAWKLWRYYLLYTFVKKQEWVLLEIKLPRDIFKSPKAMEAVLGAMWYASDGNPITRFLTNKKRPWFSLEIVSDGGIIHFYVYTQTLYRNIVESHFYAHYPQVQIVEVDDYTTRFPVFDPNSGWDFEGEMLKFIREDALPIRTYVDYALDQETKEEFKVDPLAHLLENFATASPDEQLWFQIILTSWREDGWKEEGKKVVEKLLGRDKKDTEGRTSFPPLPSKVETETVEAIERKMDKLVFKAGIRELYIFKKDKGVDKRKTIGLYAAAKSFGSGYVNTLVKGMDLGYSFAWQDPLGWRDRKDRRTMFWGYVLRSHFYPPVIAKKELTMILSTEEVATLFHLPGEVAQPPTLSRIESKRREAPPNLPI